MNSLTHLTKNLPKPNGSSKDWAYIWSGQTLSVEDAKMLEEWLISSPDNLASRLLLLGFYSQELNQKQLYKHMLWMVSHRPADALTYYLDGWYPFNKVVESKQEIAETSEEWNRQIKRHAKNARVLCNAAEFFSRHEPDTCEQLYKRAKKVDVNLAFPSRQLAYRYRYKASKASSTEKKKLLNLALKEAEYSIKCRKQDSSGELIGILHEFIPTAITYGDLELAKKFLKRLHYYSQTYEPWVQYYALFSAWIALKENRLDDLNSHLQRLKISFKAEPSHVSTCDAAITLVRDTIKLRDKKLTKQILEILMKGARDPDEYEEQIELKHWLKALEENRKFKLKILLALFVFMLTTSFYPIASSATEIPKLPKVRLILQQEWSGGELVAQVQSVKNSYIDYRLKIIRKGKVIYTHAADSWCPMTLNLLDDGNLATMWARPAGNHQCLIVFGYQNGKVRQLLSADLTGMSPEFIYQNHGTAMGSKDKSATYCQRIVIPRPEWQGENFAPATADIYTWNELTGKYKIRKNVPWTKRFRYL